MKYVTLLLILFSTSILAQQDEDLLVHYKFDGNISDSSMNGYDAIPNGIIYVEDRHGNPNGAVYFDGIDDFIELPNIEELKPNLPVSFSYWVKYNNMSYEDSTVFNTSFEEDVNSGVYVNSNSQSHEINISYGDGSAFYSPQSRRTLTSNSVIDPANWKQFVIVVSDALDMKVYVDCELIDGTYSGSGGELSYSLTPGNLGRHDKSLSTGADYFKGSLDDFKYWKTELTNVDVLDLCGILSTNDNSAKDDYLTVFPNPSNGIINIKSSIPKLTGIEVYTILGELVFQAPYREQLDLGLLENGLYYMLFFGNSGERIHRKIILR